MRIAAIIGPGICQSLARDVERGAVVGRCPHDRQAERHVHAVIKMQRLQRDQPLIMIHAKRCIIAFARARRGT